MHVFIHKYIFFSMYLRMCVCMYRGVIFYSCVAVHGWHEFKSIHKSSYNLAHINKLRFMRGIEYVPRTRKYSSFEIFRRIYANKIKCTTY